MNKQRYVIKMENLKRIIVMYKKGIAFLQLKENIMILIYKMLTHLIAYVEVENNIKLLYLNKAKNPKKLYTKC